MHHFWVAVLRVVARAYVPVPVARKQFQGVWQRHRYIHLVAFVIDHVLNVLRHSRDVVERVVWYVLLRPTWDVLVPELGTTGRVLAHRPHFLAGARSFDVLGTEREAKETEFAQG